MAWISMAKVTAMLAGVAVAALATRLVSVAPSAATALSSVAAWLRPPYLYLVINAIIISIAASSRFHNNDEKSSPATSAASVVPEENITIGASCRDDRSVVVMDRTASYRPRYEREIVAVPEVIKTVDYLPDHQDEDIDRDDGRRDGDDHDQTVVIKRTDSLEEILLRLSAEKPLVSPRFGHQKPVKPSPEQGGLRALKKVTKPKRHETLENTWKAITEGRSTPLSRQMKKCDTWENHDRQIVPMDFDHLEQRSIATVKKSATFKDRTNPQLPAVAPASLRKEPSLSQDELNRRVEAFIKKFNEEMRLQRQESLNQYLEMINRGTH